MMRLALILILAGCAGVDETPVLAKAAVLRGDVQGAPGDAWLFLYEPGQGFPGSPAVPVYASAASAGRRAEGDGRFVFARVAANPYRLWGFVDVNDNFDPNIDVLAQPGAGDRVGTGTELNLQPGKTQEASVMIEGLVAREPPAFRLENGETDIALDAQPNTPVALTLLADDMGNRLDPKKVGFAIGLADADRDGRPDDANKDSIPDLSLQLVLRFVPRPGQVKAGSTVIVPVVLNPAPFLTALGGSVTTEVIVDRLQGYVLPQAQELIGTQIIPIGQPPAGEYELVALAASGQYWRIPNGLKGVLPGQGVRFHFDRSAP